MFLFGKVHMIIPIKIGMLMKLLVFSDLFSFYTKNKYYYDFDISLIQIILFNHNRLSLIVLFLDCLFEIFNVCLFFQFSFFIPLLLKKSFLLCSLFLSSLFSSILHFFPLNFIFLNFFRISFYFHQLFFKVLKYLNNSWFGISFYPFL